MFPAHATYVSSSISEDPRPYYEYHLRKSAVLFSSATRNGIFSKITALFSKINHLENIQEALDGYRIKSQHALSIQSIPLEQIVGSEGRYLDFDRTFHPLSSRTRDRWVRIAAARMIGDSLPPVDLIQIEDRYYVRDGHHRISVAKALGEDFIDASVVVLELEPERKPIVSQNKQLGISAAAC